VDDDQSESGPKVLPSAFPVLFFFVDESGNELPGTQFPAACYAVPRPGEVVELPDGMFGVTAVISHHLSGPKGASGQEIHVGLKVYKP